MSLSRNRAIFKLCFILNACLWVLPSWGQTQQPLPEVTLEEIYSIYKRPAALRGRVMLGAEFNQSQYANELKEYVYVFTLRQWFQNNPSSPVSTEDYIEFKQKLIQNCNERSQHVRQLSSWLESFVPSSDWSMTCSMINENTSINDYLDRMQKKFFEYPNKVSNEWFEQKYQTEVKIDKLKQWCEPQNWHSLSIEDIQELGQLQKEYEQGVGALLAAGSKTLSIGKSFTTIAFDFSVKATQTLNQLNNAILRQTQACTAQEDSSGHSSH